MSLFAENCPEVISGGQYPSVHAINGAVTTVLPSLIAGRSTENPKSLNLAVKCSFKSTLWLLHKTIISYEKTNF